MTKAVVRLFFVCVCMWVGGRESRAELPLPTRFFACPLQGESAAFKTPTHWVQTMVSDTQISISLPPGWKSTEGSIHPRFEAPMGQISITLRRSGPLKLDGLKRLRRVIELTELGPSHAHPRCEKNLGKMIHGVSGWASAQVGVYGRPMGERKRTYALFGTLPKGSLTVLITTRWKSSENGPDLHLIRRLMAGIHPTH
jgi:hypothetical protein